MENKRKCENNNEKHSDSKELNKKTVYLKKNDADMNKRCDEIKKLIAEKENVYKIQKIVKSKKQLNEKTKEIEDSTQIEKIDLKLEESTKSEDIKSNEGEKQEPIQEEKSLEIPTRWIKIKGWTKNLFEKWFVEEIDEEELKAEKEKRQKKSSKKKSIFARLKKAYNAFMEKEENDK